MKPLLFVLLAASLVANVALLVSSRRSTSSETAAGSTLASGAPAPGSVPGQAQSTTAANRPRASSASTAAPVPFAWPTTHTDQDLHRVVAGLRAGGYPAAVIRAVVNQLLNERFAARSPNAGLPFWKRGAPTPEAAAAQIALNTERQALFESLLGPDARPSATLEADARERRYGPLSDDKIDAIVRIERDYSDITTETWAKRRGNIVTNGDSMMQTQLLMEKEKLADLTSLLTPEELAQYDMRNSTSARTLINNVRNVDLTAAEYAKLYEVQKAFDDANPVRSGMDAAAYTQRQLAQMALNDQARAVLGDARFYSYLEGADRNYAMVAQSMTKYPTVTQAATYEVYQLQVGLQSQMAQMSRGGAPGPDKIEEMRNTIAAFNTKLEAAVGPEVAEAYRGQGMGRIFTSFRPAPPRALVPAAK